MSIRCNPGAPDPVSEEFMQQFYTQDPDIVDLDRQTRDLKVKIKWKHRFIKQAPKKERTEYQDLQKQLTSAKKSLKTEIDDTQRKDYFFSIHNVMMKRQLERRQNPVVTESDEADMEPVIVHQLQERTRLQEVLCDLSRDLSPRDIVARKILAIDLMTALGSRQELQTHKSRLTRLPLSAPKQQTPSPSPQLPEFPVVCEKTQCIFCLGNEQLSYEQRMFRFSRVSHMMDHIERVHLKYQQVTERVICHHPVCISRGLVLQNVNYFKHHVQAEHSIRLREPRYIE
jgi:hypothetical protein